MTQQKTIGIEQQGKFDAQAFEKAVADMLHAAGFRESSHLDKTPARVRALWSERLLSGYDADCTEILGQGFADDRQDMVLIRDIAISGTCPHHLVPFRGVAHVAYMPDGRLHGFGRIARMVDALSQRLTYQEWLTRDIVDALMIHGRAKGAAAVLETSQMCLLLGENRRGDERVYTQAFSGVFSENTELSQRFLLSLQRA